MFPFRVVMVGCDNGVLAPLQRELQTYAINIEASFWSINEVLEKRKVFQGDPRLFLVHLKSELDRRDVKRLSTAFPGCPLLALVDESENVAGLLGAMRAGASQIVLLPLESADFKEALDCIARQCGRSAPEAVVVAVSGVAGGCGATTLAINLAHEVARGRGVRTILAELSLQMGMIVTYLDFDSKFGLEDLLSYADGMDVHVVEQSLTRISDTLSILPGPRRPVPLSAVAQSKIAGILGYLKQLADVVVLDVPCTFDDAYFDLLHRADQVVLVGEQRIPAVRNVQLVLETLGHKEAEGKQHLVLNRYDPGLEGFTAPELEKLLHLPRVLTMANDPRRMTAALNQGVPLQKASPHSPVLADVKELTRILFHLDEAPVRPTGSGVVRRLFQAVGLG